MGMYLNQLPPTEVARLKAELAETLIANFCYPRFYDYRTNGLRMRPVDRGKRQEVWQYLNAVDFNVWGRVDVDSPDFPRQIEKLFILFVQRNRSFFGEQGRKRMADVRTLISSCSLTLAEGLRGHLRGQQENPPFGSPRPVISWSGAKGSRPVDLPWEQILPGTMQLQQQLQEVRGEIRPASSPLPSTSAQAQAPASAARPGSVPARRPRTARPALATNGVGSNGSAVHESEAMMGWPPAGKGTLKSDETRAPFATSSREVQRGELPPYAAAPDVAPTMPLPLGRVESAPAGFQPPAPTEASPSPQSRSRRGRLSDASSATPSGALPRTPSQSQTFPVQASPAHSLQNVVGTDLTVKQPESTAVLSSDEDVVIFEQMRHQLLVWLRIEAVRSGIELNGQGAFQLAEALRSQDDIDPSRLQVVSTLLTLCDQVIKSGHATLFDYKQAMMFYLMHTRRSR